MYPCNKCKRGVQQEGDSWCVGCSALELSQQQLAARWQNPGVRRCAEEVLLSGARVVKALANLDRTLITETGAGERTRPITTAPKVLPAPPPPPRERSPRRREERRDLRLEPARKKEVRKEKSRSAGHAETLPTGDTYSESDFEEEEEEEPRSSRKEVQKGDRRPPEPSGPPPTREEAKGRAGTHRQGHPKRSKKKTRRGGKKHQKFWKQASDPFKVKHRKLSGPVTNLASSFKAGVERRV